MELIAYIHEEFINSDEAIATDINISETSNIESTFQAWLKRLTTNSAKLSLNVILAGTTLVIGLGSTLNALAEVTPSSDVKYVQSLLAKNGFDPGAIDGVAGASTKNAIIRAQQSLGLTADGVAGSQTITALEEGGSVTKVIAQADPKTDLLETNASVSSTVMNLQKLLADRGFYNGAVDGIMGSQTRNAIIAAQKAYNLTPDGVVGSRTLSALESDGSTTTVTPISATTTTKSAEVSSLQGLLSKRGFYNGAIDGLMGPQTRLAIVAAQKNYGLVPDGIAGSQTLSALESGSSNVNVADKNRDSISTTTDTKSNKDVLALQQLLAKRGFYKGSLDGVKGAQTNAAIASAQTAYGLTPDGIAGAQTIAALQKDARPSISSTTKPATSQPTNQATKPAASSGNEDGVANLQNLLADRGFYNGPVTGFLGSRTKEAIIAAQKAYGLTADGVAGARTIAALEAGAPRQQVTVNTSPTIRVETKPQATPQTTPQPQPTVAQPTVTQPTSTPQTQPKAPAAPAAQAKTTTAATPQASASDPQVLTLQNLLIKRGFYNGKADGVLTGETRNAIVRAQNFYTISPADGSPSNKLIDSLSKDTFISEGN